jgi:hypothetical protein
MLFDERIRGLLRSVGNPMPHHMVAILVCERKEFNRSYEHDTDRLSGNIRDQMKARRWPAELGV